MSIYKCLYKYIIDIRKITTTKKITIINIFMCFYETKWLNE